MHTLFLLLVSALLRFNSIKIEGSNFFSARELKKILSIKKGTPYNLLYLRSREAGIIDLYRGYGFFDVSVAEKKIEFKKTKVNIILEVKEEKRYIVNKINIHPEKVLKETSVLKHRNIKGYFSYELLGEIEDYIIRFYANRGYPFVSITDSVIPDKSSHTVDVDIRVRTGKRYIIDSVHIERVPGVRSALIKKVILIKRGQFFSRELILKSLREINALGIYEGTTYSLKETSDSTLTVIIRATPSPSRFVRLSGGYNIPEEFHGTFRLGHDNIFGNAQKITIQYEFLRSIKYPLRRKVEIYYTEPLFLGEKLSFQTHPFYVRDYELGNELYGFDVSLGKRLSNYSILRFFIGWKNLSMGRDEHGISNTAIITFSANRTNNFFYPTRGIKYTIKLQETGGILKGDFSFRRGYLSLSLYHSIEGYVFALHNTLMYQKPFGTTSTIPLDEKFRIGGDGSLRGTGRDYIMTDGGILFNLEIRRKLTRWFGMALFLDNFYVLTGMHDFIQTPGAGLRFYTPAGPIRLDIASPIHELNNVHLNIAIGEMF